MKSRYLLLVVLCALPLSLNAEDRSPQQGTIVRMRLTECIEAQHPLMDALSGGTTRPPSADLCPEYVLVSDKVVFVIVAKTSRQLVPLAETTRFRLQNSEVLIRVDDAHRESKFHVKEMVLRPDWDRYEQVADTAPSAGSRRDLESAAVRETRDTRR
jgi:hypothetical protein